MSDFILTVALCIVFGVIPVLCDELLVGRVLNRMSK